MSSRTHRPRLHVSTLLSVLLLASAAIVFAGPATTITVDENNGEWGFESENAEVGHRAFAPGPPTPPLGESSVQFAVDGQARELIGTPAFNGTRFDEIDTLGYFTYRRAPDTGVLAISLQFNVDYDLTDMNEDWQGRLVFEPYFSGTVNPDVWQEWDALAGAWWSSGSPGNAECPQGDPCTWAAFPDAGVHQTLGGLILKAGGPWTDFYGAADALTLGGTGGLFGAGQTFTFDFETANLLFADGFESGDVTVWSSSQ